ncbi:CHAT domain-containing protein [Streptomyces sp. NPDC001978]|uniref:CHAT domain-containing protein n=1 Tax=Streptomyces sp. NPDC001978 TaxID=3364627 RepID=UPI0036A93292
MYNHSARNRVTDRRVALAAEWDDLVRRARGLGPEFADFLAPPRLGALTAAVGTGTAVLINLTRRRSDALLVSASGVRSVALSGIDADDASERIGGHLIRLQEVETATARLHRTGDCARLDPIPSTIQAYQAAKLEFVRSRAELDDNLLGLLEWMWDTITEPVLTAVGTDGCPDGTRLWWCPTGSLAFMPLHAAGYHDGTGRSMLDQTVSSYTPTLRALAMAQRPSASREPDRMLVVAVDDLEGRPLLPQTAMELDLLRELFPPDRLTVIEGRAATRAVVLAELLRHSWVHFSCHGRQDVLRPSRGGLLLDDGILTVADLSRGSHDGTFAFLSACMTATGAASLSDEMITLGASVHHAGFRHVLAALWSIEADVAASVAADVYCALTSEAVFDSGNTAAAVTAAVRRLRDKEPRHPSRWAAFTHIGP